MEKPEGRSPEAGLEGKKLPWECPTMTLAGTISLLVRSGSGQGKGSGNFDGDACQFIAPGFPECQR